MSTPPQRHGRQMEEAWNAFATRGTPVVKELEEELRGVIAFVNDRVIPPVRNELIHVARVVSGDLAGGLRRLADQLDRHLLRDAASRSRG